MRYLAFLLLALFLISCSSKEKSEVKSIDVLSPNGPELKNLSEIATDVQYIPLETVPKALMRFVSYLKTGNDKFYINNASEILCFDRTGKFLHKLSQQGRGPNQYVYLSDYDILPGKNLMIVLTRGKLHFYDEVDTGFVLKKSLNLKLQPQYCDFFPGSENILLSFPSSTGEFKYQSVLISPEGDTLYKKPNFYKFTRNSKVVMGFSTDIVVQNIENTLRIKGYMSDTIFNVSNDYIYTPYIILNTGGKAMTSDFLANMPVPDMKSDSNPFAGFLQVSGIVEVGRYLFYRYSYQQSGAWGVYDKTTDLSHQFDWKVLLKDDISGGVSIEPKFVCDGKIYSWTAALPFKTHMNSDEFRNAEVKNPQRKSELKKLAESVKEDDNHLLIVVTPKK
jgi:hypothetical protein